MPAGVYQKDSGNLSTLAYLSSTRIFLHNYNLKPRL